MMNENAPTELDVQDRIKEVEKFLEEKEDESAKINSKHNEEVLNQLKKMEKNTTNNQAWNNHFDQKLNQIQSKVATQEEFLNVLNKISESQEKISENQEIERKRYERNNPVEGDEPIYDWAEETINPGFIVRFILNVPEGHVFYFEYLNITYNLDTTYYIWIDGAYEPTLTDTLQDFGDHNQIYKPPKMCYNTAEVWCLNTRDTAQTYDCFFRGFLRWYRSINREIEYESLKKTPEEKRGI